MTRLTSPKCRRAKENFGACTQLEEHRKVFNRALIMSLLITAAQLAETKFLVSWHTLRRVFCVHTSMRYCDVLCCWKGIFLRVLESSCSTHFPESSQQDMKWHIKCTLPDVFNFLARHDTARIVKNEDNECSRVTEDEKRRAWKTVRDSADVAN